MARTLWGQALQLQDRLESLGSESVVVPVVRGTKMPAVKHSGGHTWTAREARQWKNADVDVGILLKSELVLDFDDRGGFLATKREFPELARAPTETTRRGVHVFFRRSAALDAAGFTDCPLRDPVTRAKLNIDAKTVTGSEVGGRRTRGLLVVAPTRGREWLPGLSLLKVDPPEPSAALVTWLLKRGVKAGKGGGACVAKACAPSPHARQVKASCSRPVVRLDEEGQPHLVPLPEVDALDASLAGGFTITAVYSERSAANLPLPGGPYRGLGVASTYLWKETKGARACPVCFKAGGHLNSYRMVYLMESGERAIDNMSPHCQPKWMPLPFSAAACANIRRRFEAQCAQVPPEGVAALALWASRHLDAVCPFPIGLGFSLGRWLFLRGAEVDASRYLVIGKPTKSTPSFTFRIDDAPWLGSRLGRAGATDTPLPDGAASTTELGDILYAPCRPGASVQGE